MVPTTTTTTSTTSNRHSSATSPYKKAKPNDIGRMILFSFLFATLLRIAIGMQPHSGQDDYHGASTASLKSASFKETTTSSSNPPFRVHAYGGDYEAQRHWMEIAYHLPIGQWYWYDLEYWGLDYPPLTAYVSYICGMLSHKLIGPETVALDTSRGYEDVLRHKPFMRATVLVLDILVFGSATFMIAFSKLTNNPKLVLWTLLITSCQPSILLIDHGHFQYNTVALGLSLWSMHYIAKESKPRYSNATPTTFETSSFYPNCIIGSILFCLALNFKQMTLYYAPPIFCYLLGRCIVPHKTNSTRKSFSPLRFLSLAVTVLVTFEILWEPFLKYGPANTTIVERAIHVLQRIFPFQRGLFEGKVSNLWCALSIHPFRIRSRIPTNLQPLIALGTTILLILPSCWSMFWVGVRRGQVEQATTELINGRRTGSNKERIVMTYNNDDFTRLLWGTTSSALAFFLASFQVHEKSILLAVAPLSLVFDKDPKFVEWASIVAVWSLYPLLQLDRLQVAYTCATMIFCCICWLCRATMPSQQQQEQQNFAVQNPYFAQGFFASTSAIVWHLFSFVPMLCYLGMTLLHIAEQFMPSPERYPDLYPVIWSIVGCGMFGLAWIGTCWHLLSMPRLRERRTPTNSGTKLKVT